MNNWDYARETPASGWRGMMSAPRELALTRAAGRIVLVQRFPAELTAAWPALCSLQDVTVDGALLLDAVAGATLLIEASFVVTESSASVLGLRLRASEVEAARVGYDVARQELFAAGGAGELAALRAWAPEL